MQIQNPSAGAIIRDEAGLTLAEGFPNELARIVQPVIDMTPSSHRKDCITFAGGSSATGTVTIYTGTASKRLVITGYLLSVAKNATCDAATSSIGIVYQKNGVAQTLCSIAGITLTAQDQTIIQTLKDPIYCDENSSVSCAAVFTAGAMRRTIIVFGYEESTR